MISGNGTTHYHHHPLGKKKYSDGIWPYVKCLHAPDKTQYEVLFFPPSHERLVLEYTFCFQYQYQLRNMAYTWSGAMLPGSRAKLCLGSRHCTELGTCLIYSLLAICWAWFVIMGGQCFALSLHTDMMSGHKETFCSGLQGLSLMRATLPCSLLYFTACHNLLLLTSLSAFFPPSLFRCVRLVKTYQTYGTCYFSL